MPLPVTLAAWHLFQSCDQFIQLLWSGVFTVQKSFDIRGDHLPLHSRTFAVLFLFRDGDAVSAGVLGAVHTGISHTNDVFNGEAVCREAADPKASGNVVLLQHALS